MLISTFFVIFIVLLIRVQRELFLTLLITLITMITTTFNFLFMFYLNEQIPEIKISYSQGIPFEEQFKVISSATAVEAFKSTWDSDLIECQEEFKVMLLNNSLKVKGIFSLSKGGLTGTVVDVRLVFAVALKSCSTYICLAHNHPSGTPKPSEADKNITKQLVEAGRILNIIVFDHIILTPYDGYFSFADEGLL